VLQAERLILHTVGFDFNVEHPYKHILNIARELGQREEQLEIHHRRATQVAWNFANDRYLLETPPVTNLIRHVLHELSANVAVLQFANHAMFAVLFS